MINFIIVCAVVITLGIIIGYFVKRFLALYVSIILILSLVQIVILGINNRIEEQTKNIELVFGEDYNQKKVCYLMKSYPQKTSENHFNWIKRLKQQDEPIKQKTIVHTKSQNLYIINLSYKCNNTSVKTIFIICNSIDECYELFNKNELNKFYNIIKVEHQTTQGIFK